MPLAGAVFNGILGLFIRGLRKNEWVLGSIGTAVVAVPFVLTLVLFLQGFDEAHVASYYTWMAAGDLSISIFRNKLTLDINKINLFKN